MFLGSEDEPGSQDTEGSPPQARRMDRCTGSGEVAAAQEQCPGRSRCAGGH